MQHKAKPHQHPRQIRGGEDQQPQERELGVRVAARPDVDEDAGEGVAEEDHGDEGGEGDEEDAGVDKDAGAYLVLVEDGVEAVKELKRADDVALDEDAGEDCCGGPETTLPPTSQDTNHTHDVPSARAARALPLQRGNPQILQRQNHRHDRLKAHVLQRRRARRPRPTAQKASLPPRHRGTTRNPAIPAHDRPSDAEAPLLAAGARDCDDARAAEPGAEVAEPGDSGAAGGGGGVLGASV
ncbi:hypothetical protein V492_04897 [Pseudogymnoascus sp. VKM F-4246]|nr:hypothetical protein V492_04897 [Pseudogymnoascus sp. VKM F-4246]